MRMHIWHREPTSLELAGLSLNDKIFCTDNRWMNSFNREVEIWNLEAIKSDVNKRFLQQVAQFSDWSIAGTPFAEKVEFNGFWSWYYFKFKAYFTVREWLYEWDLLTYLNENYSDVHYYTSLPWISDYRDRFSSVQIHVGSPSSIVKKSSMGAFIRYCFRSFLRAKSFKIFHHKHLIIDKSIQQNFWDVRDDRMKEGNIYLNHLIDRKDENAVVISDKDIPPFKSHHSVVYNNIPQHPVGESLFFRSLMNPMNVFRTFFVYRKYNRTINNCDIGQAPIEKQLILRFLKREKKSLAIYYFKFLAWSRFFKKHPIASLTLIDENSPLVRSVVDAARMYNVPVLAIQHGSIHPAHPAYMYSKDDAQRNVFPFQTLVWGDYWKEILIKKGNYPEKSICVVGQQRTDSILELIQRKEHFKRLYSLPEATILFFATQPQQDVSMRRQAAKDVFTALKNMHQVHGLIKLHPAEKNDEMYYRAIAVEVGCSNFSFAKEMDLYIGLALADIVITAFSTVGTEAVYFKKPILIWDPLEQDLLGLIDMGLGFQVKNADDIMQICLEVIEKKISKSLALFEQYIETYAYKIDGNVSARIWQIIQNA